jgi:hypothetical protein
MKDKDSSFLFFLLLILGFNPKPIIFGISILDESVFPFGFNIKVKFSILFVGFNSKISLDK